MDQPTVPVIRVFLTPIQFTKMGDRMQNRPIRPKTMEFPALI